MIKKIYYENLFLIIICLLLTFSCTSPNTSNRTASVYLQKEDSRYTLIRNGRAFQIKGAAGFTHLKELSEFGGNTIRIYDTTNITEILDSAYKYNIAVIAGLPLPKSQSLEVYNNESWVNKMQHDFLKVVEKNKNHPALLMWALGNELRFPNKFKYRNFYRTFNDISSAIHQTDPNHPITTSIENLSATDVFNIKLRTKYIDIISINTFSALPRLKKDLENYSWLWDGPFIVSEWGIPGTWEEKRTSWGAPIEKTSSEKAAFLSRYQKYLPKEDARCLGSLVFYWGAKQERTHTWYNLFSEAGLRSEPLNMIAKIWADKEFENRAPRVKRIALNQKSAKDNLIFKASTLVKASVLMQDPEKDLLEYKWEVLPEDWYFVNEENKIKPKAIKGLVKQGNLNALSFRTPAKEGPYRVFVTAFDHKGNFATANIPFYVMN